MKHHIKMRHVGRSETDCGKMLRDKNELTTSRMDTDCPSCLKVIHSTEDRDLLNAEWRAKNLSKNRP